MPFDSRETKQKKQRLADNALCARDPLTVVSKVLRHRFEKLIPIVTVTVHVRFDPAEFFVRPGEPRPHQMARFPQPHGHVEAAVTVHRELWIDATE